MAASKSQKIQAEIDKVKAKISEQQARLKELEQKHREAENEEIVDIVRGMSVSLDELPLVLQRLRDGGTSGQSVQKSAHGPPQSRMTLWGEAAQRSGRISAAMPPKELKRSLGRRRERRKIEDETLSGDGGGALRRRSFMRL